MNLGQFFQQVRFQILRIQNFDDRGELSAVQDPLEQMRRDDESAALLLGLRREDFSWNDWTLVDRGLWPDKLDLASRVFKILLELKAEDQTLQRIFPDGGVETMVQHEDVVTVSENFKLMRILY